MESVTQEKKKLRSVISFEAQAPPGYTFIPAGNPQFTDACKEICRRDGLKVFAVTTTPHQRMHNLSQQVHRIGYHFPSAVVATVCMDLGLYLTSSGKVMPFQGITSHRSHMRAASEVSQTTINTEARDVIRDLFPNIPEKDLNQIIKTAFQKGQRKVGTAVELPLARRAQLAVVAHIRHIYTNYDRLLKKTSFQEARSLVEDPTLAKLVEWRGDDENGKTVLEDVFREVIVISDDEDSDAESDPGTAYNDRDTSIEILSSNTAAGELQTKPLDYADRSLREAPVDLADDDAPPGFRFVPAPPKRTRSRNDRIDRRGFSRYEAWNRARFRYREKALADHQANTHVRTVHNSGSSYVGGPLSASERPVYGDLLSPNANALERRPFTSRHVHPLPSASVPLSVDGRGTSFPTRSQPQRPPGTIIPYRDNLEMKPQDRALPSIEDPQSPSSAVKSPGDGGIYGSIKRRSDAIQPSSLTSISRPHERESTIIDLTSMRDVMPKRRRVECQEPARDVSGFGSSRVDGHISDPVPCISLLSPDSGRRAVPGYNSQTRSQHLSPDTRYQRAPRCLERVPLRRVSPPSRLPGANVVRYADSEYVNRQDITIPLSRDGLNASSNQTTSQPNYGPRQDRLLNTLDTYPRPDRLYQIDQGPPNTSRRISFEETELRGTTMRRPEVITTSRGLDHGQNRNDIYSPDFVRPVSIHGPLAPSYRLAHRDTAPNREVEPVSSRPTRYSPIVPGREQHRPRREMISQLNPNRSSQQAPIDLSSERLHRIREKMPILQDSIPVGRSRYAAPVVSQYDASRGAIIDSTRYSYALPRIEDLAIRSSRNFLGS
ncbi:hypothetical protein DTO166G4_590 [Paecilomyces variotii]|nr:hypothetical protein DTO164E3_7819 [Paecilomyces variotii]KAJ9217786.1 hypothetical protein DTO166G4_590 [Paecilomyces variotii]KAJ9230861.1 hypothetical protein DTO166G5_7100 [Paecilomyces variotii]KAJ9234575.1 hypothetical protein DTO169E5_6526 [Paecilomyces variotii]KAJ9247946.1 hypothetical protein DTO207G8_7713 [Paecilomyces variotii]